jgi:hypothetical protein
VKFICAARLRCRSTRFVPPPSRLGVAQALEDKAAYVANGVGNNLKEN